MWRVLFEIKRGWLPPKLRRRLPKGQRYAIVVFDATPPEPTVEELERAGLDPTLRT